MDDKHKKTSAAAGRLRLAARTAVFQLKNENLPRTSDAAWTSLTGYSYGRWANKGFNIAIDLLDNTPPMGDETEAGFLRRVIQLIRKKRDVYRADDEDEDGACSGALDAAAWAIAGVLPAETPPGHPSLSPSDPRPGAVWEVWYRDLFDRDMPPQLEASGSGLLAGLVELWARYLFETIRPGGAEGFSRFNLVWDRVPVVIEGEAAGAARLRGWVFGDQEQIHEPYTEAGDDVLLRAVANCHAQLLMVRQDGRLILQAAAAARSRAEFETSLAALAANR